MIQLSYVNPEQRNQLAAIREFGGDELGPVDFEETPAEVYHHQLLNGPEALNDDGAAAGPAGPDRPELPVRANSSSPHACNGTKILF